MAVDEAHLAQDIHLPAPGRTAVANNGGGTHSPCTGSGKLSLQGGQYKAYGQDLEIERGQLIFNGALVRATSSTLQRLPSAFPVQETSYRKFGPN